ncbi:MAG TPA: extracellular solute-binding protein [Opitutaceae bacterium]|nr:extracellular solute-binding protein [Opitutaceae bacterium]
MNRATLLLLLARATLFLGAAGFARAQELDIPVFAGGYGVGFYQDAARRFEQLRPGVKVRVYGDPRIEDKLRIRIIDGDYPDAAAVPYVDWPSLIRAGKVLDLAGPLARLRDWEGDARWGETFQPGALDSWRVGEKIYGLPFTYSCWSIFYNRGLFQEHGWSVPRTWDEFFGLCARMKAAGIAPLSLPGTRWLYPDAILRSAFYNLAGPAGWRAMTELAPGARSDPRYVRAAALLQRVMREDVAQGWEGETATGAELDLLQGRAAMTISGSWFLSEMSGRIPPDFHLGTMNFPVFPGGAGDPTTIQVGADCFFVFNTGRPERTRLTLEFLRFLTSRGRAEAFVRLVDGPVAVRGVPLGAFSPGLRDTEAMIENARAAFAMPNESMQPPFLRQALVDGSLPLMTGRITPEAYARNLEAAAEHDRVDLVHPGTVEYRHTGAAVALLAVLAALFGWLGWANLGWRRRPPAPDPEPYFGRLRTPVALGFVGPSLLLYAGLVIGPALVAVGWAFTHWDGLGPRSWVGLLNFRWLLFDSDVFWAALRNNLFLMVVPAAVVVPLALLCAALIHRGVWGAGFFRAVFLFPNLLGGIAATLLWLGAYKPHGGLVNAGLVSLGRLLGSPWLQSFDNYPWLAPYHLYAALIPIYLWMACGFNLILYLAAMEGIDPQLYEAAEIEGASAWRQFFTITLPLIREAIVISAIFLVIAGLNAFEMIWLLTSQAPTTASHTLGTFLVTTMFKNFEIGRAAALAVVLFLLVFAGSAAVWRTLRREAIEL